MTLEQRAWWFAIYVLSFSRTWDPFTVDVIVAAIADTWQERLALGCYAITRALLT